MDADVGKLAGDLPKEQGQHAHGGWIDGTDLDLTDATAAGGPCQFGRQLHLAEDANGTIVEGLPCPRQLDPTSGANEQRTSKLPLQRHDMVAERWLGDVHLYRGPTEMELLGDRAKKG